MLSKAHLRPRRSPARGVGVLGMALVITAALFTLLPERAQGAGWISPGKLPSAAGRIWGIGIDPVTPTSVIAGTDGGVFRSSDGGVTWNTTSLKATRVWALGFEPGGAHRAFAGTEKRGVFSSSDGGTTWEDVSIGLPSKNVRCIAFGVAAVAVGTQVGVAASSDGKTWAAVGPTGVSVRALTVASNSPTFTLLAGTDGGDVSGGAIYENSATGWQTLGTANGLPKGVFISGLASGPPTQANPKRSLMVNTSITSSNTGGTYRSVDGGQNWTAAQGIPMLAETQPLAPTTTVISPLDPNLVYVGSDYAGSTGGNLLRSTDGGATFAAFSGGLPENSKNVGTIAVAPTTPPIVMAGLNPPGGGALIFKITDAEAPPPPALVAEAGAPPPSAVPTPKPTPTPKNDGHASPTPTAAPSGVTKFVQSAVHWPTPLVYELLFIALAVYAFVRWRQRAYVEGPPD